MYVIGKYYYKSPHTPKSSLRNRILLMPFTKAHSCPTRDYISNLFVASCSCVITFTVPRFP